MENDIAQAASFKRVFNWKKLTTISNISILFPHEDIGIFRMKVYKINEFSRLIGRSVKTLQRWNTEGTLIAHRNPKVKKTGSFVLDENCYRVFEHEGRQYIDIMTLTPRKRLTVPLSGNTVIRGNIRIILKSQKIEVHYSSDIPATMSIENNKVTGIDFGYTEVMTDSDGQKYGVQFGDILITASDALKKKMQYRNKLHALHKRYNHSCTHKQKAKNILKINLGRIKQEKNQHKIKETLKREINTSFNQLIKKESHTIASESLTHSFSYHCGSTWNRRLSAWVRGELKERLAFKALAKGFSHQQVNPAYTSQTCFHCGFVDDKNRKGNLFKCLHCRHVSDADWIAAMNIKSRYFDQEITRYTPYRDVKKILLDRFHRHLESGMPGTVSGRIPDTAIA